MHDLEKIADICYDEVCRCTIEPGNILRFTTNSRLRKTWGRCIRKGYGTYIIEIQPFLLDDRTPLKVLKEVLIHEILHSCDDCMNHGGLWQFYAQKVSRKYGYNIEAMVTTEAMQSVASAGTYSREQRAKYIMECAGCKRRAYYNRMTDFIRNPTGYHCRYCKSKQFVRVK